MHTRSMQLLTWLRTQPLWVSSMPQDEVPRRLSVLPLCVCSMERELLLLLSSNVCHSTSSCTLEWLLPSVVSTMA